MGQLGGAQDMSSVLSKVVASLGFCLLLGFAPGIGRATLITLTPDLAQSTPPASWGGSIGNLLTDPFAYDPDNPTSPMPNIGWDDTIAYHAALPYGDVTLAFTLPGLRNQMTLDLYGRNSYVHRDNNLTVTFFSGSWLPGDITETIGGINVSDVTFHARVTAHPDTLADRFSITCPFPAPSGHDGDGNNYFTLFEVRANGIPEPSVMMLWTVGAACAMVLRRRK